MSEPKAGPHDEGDGRVRPKVVFCGGCNPHIDRTAVAAALPLDDPDVPHGATVHLSGCARACASDHQLTGRRGYDDHAEAGDAVPGLAPVVVVAGELVDGVPTAAAELAPAVTRKLKE